MFLSDPLERRFERSYRKLFEYVVSRNTGISQIDADTKTVELLEAFVTSHVTPLPYAPSARAQLDARPKGWTEIEGNGFDNINTRHE